MDIRTNLTMPRACAATATTEMEELRSLGAATMRNFMLLGCARIATSTITTEKGEKNQVNCRGKKKNSQL